MKPPALVKGVHLEGVRKLGDPGEFARRYYLAGADEISYHDAVASLYGRNSIGELLTRTASNAFVPVTVGGGIRSLEDATSLVRLGADKVCLNTAAIHTPGLIREISEVLGRQATVLGIEAKRISKGWEAMTDCGRERTGRSVVDWVAEAEAMGAGEVLLTSVDREGTELGFDLDLIASVRNACSVPIVAHGGAGKPMDAVHAERSGADAVAIASVLHFGRHSIKDFKEALGANEIEVRW